MPDVCCEVCATEFYVKPARAKRGVRYCSLACRREGQRPSLGPNPSGYCECGCGQLAPLATQSCSRFGWVKGESMRFCRGHNNAGRQVTTTRWVERDCGYETPCWVWALTMTAQGYGRCKVRRQQRYAHRVVYEEMVGPIPDGLELDHLCRNTACVNPAHLEPVTGAVNVQRGRARKLTREDVASIKASTDSLTALGARYGISRGYASMLRTGYARPKYLI